MDDTELEVRAQNGRTAKITGGCWLDINEAI